MPTSLTREFEGWAPLDYPRIDITIDWKVYNEMIRRQDQREAEMVINQYEQEIEEMFREYERICEERQHDEFNEMDYDPDDEYEEPDNPIDQALGRAGAMYRAEWHAHCSEVL